MRTALYVVAFTCGAFALVGWAWWGADVARWWMRRRARRPDASPELKAWAARHTAPASRRGPGRGR